SSLTNHLPSGTAVVFFNWPAKRTVTVSPGSAWPQIGTFCFCCSTIPAPITSGSDTLAWAIVGVSNNSANAKKRATGFPDLFMFVDLDFENGECRIALLWRSRQLDLQAMTSHWRKRQRHVTKTARRLAHEYNTVVDHNLNRIRARAPVGELDSHFRNAH